MTDKFYDELISLSSKLADTLPVLKTRLVELDRREERHRENASAIIDERQLINDREAAINRRHSVAVEHREQLKLERETIEMARKEMAAQKKELESSQAQMQKRIDSFEDLAARKRKLDTKAAKLKEIESDIVDREKMIKKETQIDRDRKKMLDERERKLQAKADRLQKMTEL